MPWEFGGNDIVAADGSDYLGTQFNAPLVIKTNAENAPVKAAGMSEAMRIIPATPQEKGRVGISTNQPQRVLHVEGAANAGEIHCGGGGAGYSFGNRRVPATGQPSPFTQIPTVGGGERWVWYASNGVARLWSGADKLSVAPNGDIAIPGKVGIGIGQRTPDRTLHVEPSEIHTGGGGAGYSFGNRQTANFVNTPANGERWVWYASDGVARLWSGADKLSVAPNGDLSVQGGIKSNGNAAIGGRLDVQGELYLGGGGRTSIGTFDGDGFHWIRSSGDDSKRWMIFANDPPNTPGRIQFMVGILVPNLWWSSDMRTKTNIRQLGGGVLDKLEPIRGVAFEWAESPQVSSGIVGQSSIGVIAQEVEEVLPELVTTYADQDYKAVDYSGLTVLLIEAIKELKAEVNELGSRIEALERA